MKFGFTGTQVGMTPQQKESLKMLLEPYKNLYNDIHHGDCIGADAEFQEIAEDILEFATVILHPPDNDSKRAFCKADIKREPKPYLVRNHEIVNECETMIACPKTRNEQQRSGTWATIRYACGRVQLYIIYPDGSGEWVAKT